MSPLPAPPGTETRPGGSVEHAERVVVVPHLLDRLPAKAFLARFGGTKPGRTICCIRTYCTPGSRRPKASHLLGGHSTRGRAHGVNSSQALRRAARRGAGRATPPATTRADGAADAGAVNRGRVCRWLLRAISTSAASMRSSRLKSKRPSDAASVFPTFARVRKTSAALTGNETGTERNRDGSICVFALNALDGQENGRPANGTGPAVPLFPLETKLSNFSRGAIRLALPTLRAHAAD